MRRIPRGFWVAVVALCGLVSPAFGRLTLYEGDLGNVEMSGFARVQADIHTAEPNPNNSALGRDNNTLQVFRQWILADTTYTAPIPGVKGFDLAKGRPDGETTSGGRASR